MILANQNIQKTWKAANKYLKILQIDIIFPKGLLLNCVKKILFDLKLWGPQKNSKTRRGSYSGLGLSINAKKTE
jgi:hypothetical protein